MTGISKSLGIGYKIVRDPIHGYVRLTKEEYDILQLPVMMRLNYIKQNPSALYVYPAMQTTRLIHSIGVVHVAYQMITRVLTSLDEKLEKNNKDKEQAYKDLFDYNKSEIIRIVRLAALLHDIGHGPFSHASEKPMAEFLTDKEKEELCNLFNISKSASSEIESHVHEYNSYKLITEGEGIKDIVTDGKIREAVGNLILKKDISSNSIGSRILKKIISSEIDADRLDYIMRDSYASGVTYGIIDMDRIIQNLKIVEEKKDKYELAIDPRAQSALEDMIDARFKMHKWVYHHHLVVAYDKMLEDVVKNVVMNKRAELELRWTNFNKGECTDNQILYYAKLYANSDCACRSLFDRRYRPISIIKRISSMRSLYSRFSENRELKEEHFNTLLQRALTKYKKELDKLIEDRLSMVGEDINIRLFGIIKPRSPYNPLKNGSILIEKRDEYDDNDKKDKFDRTQDILHFSNYVNSINEEWGKYLSTYLFMLPQNPIRPDIIKKIKKEIADSILEFVFEILYKYPE